MRRLLFAAALTAVWFLSAQVVMAAEALPVVGEDSLVRGERAASHDHWEHMVRRSTRNWGEVEEEEEKDETAEIVDLKAYYRQVFADDWETSREQRERELARLMAELQREQSYQRYYDQDRYWGKPARVSSEKLVEEQDLGVVEPIGCLKKPIRGRYMVMFIPGTSDYVLDRTIEILEKANTESDQQIRATDITPLRELGKGFVATMNGRTLRLMFKHPVVYSIEQDTAIRHAGISESETSSTDKVIWNLDRIDQHMNAPDGKYIPEGSGANVDICIVDTGIRYSHSEFEGRAVYAGYDAIDELTGSTLKGDDCHGHGTHAAATAAGKTYGVAKKANVISLRALDCSGSGAVSGIVSAMEFMVKKQKEEGEGRPLVFSLSLGVEKSVTLNAAVEEAVKAGYVVVAASGNQGGDSCRYSPASANGEISVGATDPSDRAVYFSNTGDCMDIFAPGSGITSASHTCDTCTHELSGTSMACPHVTGYAAILLSMKPYLTPQEVKDRIIAQSTKNSVSFNSLQTTLASHTPNRLLYVPEPTAADADFSNTASVESFHYRPR